MAVSRNYRWACNPSVEPSFCKSECGEGGTDLCTLENQLSELSELENPATFPDSENPRSRYAEPKRRIEEWISENTGDIVLVADTEHGSYFDTGSKTSTHGTLTYDDALVPLGFSYPGATSEDPRVDDTMDGVVRFLDPGSQGGAAIAPIERQAMEAALGLTPCVRRESGECKGQ